MATTADATEVRVLIEDWFKPMTETGFGTFCNEIHRRGWSRAQLLASWYRFLDRKYPTWVPADFFNQPEPKIYPHSWYTAQIDQQNGNPANARLIGTYNAGGKCVWGWIAEVGESLPKWVPPKPQPVPALPEPKRDTDTAASLTMLHRALKAEARVEELEKECAHLGRKIADMIAEGYTLPVATSQEYSNGFDHFKAFSPV